MIPLPTTYDEVKPYCDEGKRAYGSFSKFTCSQEYREAYPIIQRLHKDKVSSVKSDTYRYAQERGLKVGDKVYYDGVGMFFEVITLEGRIVDYEGQICAHLTKESANRTLGRKRHVKIHDGWLKCS